ncbi:hypothetical protein HanIR_Chr14g0706841 [Helianthus annuus]|nr:hypothetical protein HanIR_Chr14g0706841 [Helianthus annuus]
MEAPQVEAMSTETRNNNPPQDDEQTISSIPGCCSCIYECTETVLDYLFLWPLLDFIIITSPGASCYIHPFFLILFLCYFFNYLALIC